MAFVVREKPQVEMQMVPVRFGLVLNEDHSPEIKYATLTHELAHLYCGHLGTPHKKWWPDRQGLARETREFEAEAVSFLVCKRLGIDPPSDEYLSGYLKRDQDVPPISFECVMKAAGLIEQMGSSARLRPRKANA